jgi:hypothetical protein
MTFDPPIAARSSEELILIVHAPDEWKPEAIEQAKLELEKRAVPLPVQQAFFGQHQEQKQQEWQAELDKRRVESYSFLEAIWMIIQWPTIPFSGWNLRADGYERKARQRVQYFLMGAGILLALFVYDQIDAGMNAQNRHDEESKRIESVDISEWERSYYGTDTLLSVRDSLTSSHQ